MIEPIPEFWFLLWNQIVGEKLISANSLLSNFCNDYHTQWRSIVEANKDTLQDNLARWDNSMRAENNRGNGVARQKMCAEEKSGDRGGLIKNLFKVASLEFWF